MAGAGAHTTGMHALPARNPLSVGAHVFTTLYRWWFVQAGGLGGRGSPAGTLQAHAHTHTLFIPLYPIGGCMRACFATPLWRICGACCLAGHLPVTHRWLMHLCPQQHSVTKRAEDAWVFQAGRGSCMGSHLCVCAPVACACQELCNIPDTHTFHAAAQSTKPRGLCMCRVGTG